MSNKPKYIELKINIKNFFKFKKKKLGCGKNLKNLDTQKKTVIILKFEQGGFTIRPSLKKKSLLYSYLPTLKHPVQNVFWYFWICPFHQKIMIFSLSSGENEKKKIFPYATYPTKIYSPNKQFFKDDLE